jgi:hypothetical protein
MCKKLTWNENIIQKVAIQPTNENGIYLFILDTVERERERAGQLQSSFDPLLLQVAHYIRVSSSLYIICSLDFSTKKVERSEFLHYEMTCSKKQNKFLRI